MATGVHHFDAILGLQAMIRGFGLTGVTGASPLPNARVYAFELIPDREDEVVAPCVVVSKAPMPESYEITDNRTREIGYPCMVTIIVPKNQDPTLDQGPLEWRQRIMEATDMEQPQEVLDAMADGVTLRQTDWRPLDVIDLELFKSAGLNVSAAIVFVRCWLPR